MSKLMNVKSANKFILLVLVLFFGSIFSMQPQINVRLNRIENKTDKPLVLTLNNKPIKKIPPQTTTRVNIALPLSPDKIYPNEPDEAGVITKLSAPTLKIVDSRENKSFAMVVFVRREYQNRINNKVTLIPFIHGPGQIYEEIDNQLNQNISRQDFQINVILDESNSIVELFGTEK